VPLAAIPYFLMTLLQEIFHVLQAASRAIGKTILFDPLPGEKLSLNSIDISPENFLSMIISRFPDYSLINDPDYYYIKRNTVQNTAEQGSAANTIFMHEEDSFSINITRGELLATLEELFTKANKEYVLLFKSSSVLRDLNYTQKSFHELLKLLLVQTGGDYTVSNDIYYIFDINRQDILKQYKSAEYLQLKYLSAEDIPTLLPNVLSSSTFYKINKDRNGLILSGSIEEIRPLKEYIASIDIPLSGRQYYTFFLDYIKATEAVESLPSRLKSPAPFLMKESNAFLSLYTKDQKIEVDSILNVIDLPMETHVRNSSPSYNMLG
jgi:general secretion pathway protein D